MICPFCKSRVKVVDTNSRSYTNYRKRICTVCERKFYTKEICIQESEGRPRFDEKWQEWKESRKNKLNGSENDTM